MLRFFSVSPKRSAKSIFLKVCVVSLAALLTGCVKPTKFPRYLTVADIIKNVKCELHNAILKSVHEKNWLLYYSALLDLELEVFREGNLNTDASYVVPYLGGTGAINLMAGLKKSSKSKLAFDFLADTSLGQYIGMTYKNKKWMGLPNRNPSYCEKMGRDKRHGKYTAGETGLSIWLNELIKGINDTNVEIENATDGFSYSVEFIVTGNGSIIPRVDRFRTNEHRVFGFFNASRTRRDTHKLTIVFKKVLPLSMADTQLKALRRIEKLLGGIPPAAALSGMPERRTKPTTPELPRSDQEIRRQLRDQLQREFLRDIQR